MKKAALALFIVMDLGVMGATGFYLMSYVHAPRMTMMPKMTSFPMTAPASPISTATVKTGTIALSPPPSTGAATSTRKILFTYRNPHARIVAIRADFTGWKAEPMQKGANGNWTYQAQLTPGEYAYCYTADDKTFKDPANKRTKQIGRTLVSAILVEALPAGK